MGPDRPVDRSGLHATKQRDYEKLIVRLQALAVTIVKADRAKCEAIGQVKLGKRADVEWIAQPEQPQWRDFSDGTSLELLTPPPDIARDDRWTEPYKFWRFTRWRHGTDSRATSWLEMFILFRFLGGWG